SRLASRDRNRRSRFAGALGQACPRLFSREVPERSDCPRRSPAFTSRSASCFAEIGIVHPFSRGLLSRHRTETRRAGSQGGCCKSRAFVPEVPYPQPAIVHRPRPRELGCLLGLARSGIPALVSVALRRDRARRKSC